MDLVDLIASGQVERDQGRMAAKRRWSSSWLDKQPQNAQFGTSCIPDFLITGACSPMSTRGREGNGFAWCAHPDSYFRGALLPQDGADYSNTYYGKGDRSRVRSGSAEPVRYTQIDASVLAAASAVDTSRIRRGTFARTTPNTLSRRSRGPYSRTARAGVGRQTCMLRSSSISLEVVGHGLGR